MTIRWASYTKVKEAAEELKGLIRSKYPDAEFKLVRAVDQQQSWHLLVMVDVDDLDDIGDLVIDREVDMLVEEHIPIHVIPIHREARRTRPVAAKVRRTG